MPEETEKIVQLIPAEGWNAVYWRNTEPYYDLVKLVSFALIEDSAEKRGVSGVDQFLFLCNLNKNFGGYFHVEDVTEKIRAEWSETGRRLAEG